MVSTSILWIPSETSELPGDTSKFELFVTSSFWKLFYFMAQFRTFIGQYYDNLYCYDFYDGFVGTLEICLNSLGTSLKEEPIDARVFSSANPVYNKIWCYKSDETILPKCCSLRKARMQNFFFPKSFSGNLKTWNDKSQLLSHRSTLILASTQLFQFIFLLAFIACHFTVNKNRPVHI